MFESSALGTMGSDNPETGSVELRRELLNLAEPVIADCINEGYRGRDGDAGRMRLLSAQHRRVWRAILLRRHDVLASLAYELRDGIGAAGMDAGVVDEIDTAVLDELVEISVRRFRSSAGKARLCSLILLDAATFMGESQANARAPSGH